MTSLKYVVNASANSSDRATGVRNAGIFDPADTALCYLTPELLYTFLLYVSLSGVEWHCRDGGSGHGFITMETMSLLLIVLSYPSGQRLTLALSPPAPSLRKVCGQMTREREKV